MAFRNVRDRVYTIVIGTQLFGMLVLDLVAFYPKSLWQAPSAPLHFLVTLRDFYVSFSGDPFFAHPQHEPWFEAFLFIEGVAQLPLCAYFTYKMATSKVTSGATELAGLALGCLTGMGSVVASYHLSQLGEDMVSAEKKMLLYGQYVPFAIIPIFMAFDMHQRLLSRINAVEGKAKKQ